MLPLHNNPAVSLGTRRWIEGVRARGDLLDDPCTDMLLEVLTSCLHVHPGGLIHDQSLLAGAASQHALLAGSITELFYTVASFTDDLQDGDTARYLGEHPFSLQLNTQSQLLCLIAKRAEEAANHFSAQLALSVMVSMYETGVAMLTGQREEIVRTPWDPAAYERVSQLSAGNQFNLYFRLVAAVSDGPTELWGQLGSGYGKALQLIADWRSSDDRLTSFSQTDIRRLRDRTSAEIQLAAAALDNLCPLTSTHDALLSALGEVA